MKPVFVSTIDNHYDSLSRGEDTKRVISGVGKESKQLEGGEKRIPLYLCSKSSTTGARTPGHQCPSGRGEERYEEWRREERREKRWDFSTHPHKKTNVLVDNFLNVTPYCGGRCDDLVEKAKEKGEGQRQHRDT